jgi:hypothetical protein
MALRKCYWLPYANEFLPSDALPTDWNSLGTQSANALNAGLEGTNVSGIDVYRDTNGVAYAVVGLEGEDFMILREKCGGSTVMPYVIGMGVGAAALGIGASRFLKRFRPASTLIGAALGMVAGGGVAHAMTRRAYGGNEMQVSGRMGLVKATKERLPPQAVGSLYLPRDGSLPRDMRIGLVNAAKRYRPRSKNW